MGGWLPITALFRRVCRLPAITTGRLFVAAGLGGRACIRGAIGVVRSGVGTRLWRARSCIGRGLPTIGRIGAARVLITRGSNSGSPVRRRLCLGITGCRMTCHPVRSGVIARGRIASRGRGVPLRAVVGVGIVGQSGLSTGCRMWVRQSGCRWFLGSRSGHRHWRRLFAPAEPVRRRRDPALASGSSAQQCTKRGTYY